MQRLAGSDAGFLFIESPTQTSVCVDLVELSAPEAGHDPLTRDALLAHLAERIHLVPSFRWRLERVPLGVHHPVWVEDPDFDLDHHVRRATVAAPGGPAEVDAAVAAVLPDRLDLRHPLWRVTLLDGLADGRQALLFQFHHSLADGAALLTSLGRLFGSAPVAPAPPWRPAPIRRAALFLRAFLEQLRNWLQVPALLVRTLRRFKAVEERRKVGTVTIPGPMGDAPASPLNRSVTDHRVYARTTIPIADLQLVKRAAGTTLSDVLLSSLAGGLRTHLLDRDELPEAPLVANVPVDNDPPGAEPRQFGNRFANFVAPIATDVADPLDQLRAVAEATTEAKVLLDVQGRDTLPLWLDRIPPAIAEPASRAMNRRVRRHPEAPDFNLLVSNVRVLDPTWTIGHQHVDHLYMSGPIADGAGLNVTVTGFGPELHVAVVANPTAVDDPAALLAATRAALDRLLAAVEVPCSD